MKSVKFFSCLVSCGIFLANPSSAMDEHYYKEPVSYCNCDFKPKYFVFISKYSADDQFIMVKLAQYLKNYFSNSINLPKLKLFKEYFDNLKLDKRIQCKMVRLDKLLDNLSNSDLIDAGVINDGAEIISGNLDEYFREIFNIEEPEKCDDIDGFKIYKSDSNDGISFSMVMKAGSDTYPIFNFKEKDIKKFLD